MRNTTTWQIPYPESPDHTRTWEYWQAIAERVDACLTQVNQKPLWSVYANTATADIGQTLTAAFTAPSATYKAGRAYRLEMVSHVRCTVAATQMSLNVMDTNTSGTVRGSINHWIPTPTQNFFFTWPWNIANATAADITRVLVLAIRSSSSTNLVLLNPMTTGNRYWTCTDIGLAADHPEAVTL